MNMKDKMPGRDISYIGRRQIVKDHEARREAEIRRSEQLINELESCTDSKKYYELLDDFHATEWRIALIEQELDRLKPNYLKRNIIY